MNMLLPWASGQDRTRTCRSVSESRVLSIANLLALVVAGPVLFFAAVLARRLRLVVWLAALRSCGSLQVLLGSKSLEIDLEQLGLAVRLVVARIVRLQEHLRIFVLLWVVVDEEGLLRGLRGATCRRHS